MNILIRYSLILFLFLAQACQRPDSDAPLPVVPKPSSGNLTISTNKAMYSPDEEVVFTLNESLTAPAFVRYTYLNEVVGEESVSGTSWIWKAPVTDFKGYMATVYQVEDYQEKVLTTVGVDVSSDWSRFPRYGFLSKFSEMSESDINGIIENLNRHHINGIQFQDWHYKHHKPWAGTPVWKDIANRENYLSTVKGYIDAAHDRNMKAISYNLIYGALQNAAQDGVSEEWYLYKDKNHSLKDKHPLPNPPFISDIFLVNPGNAAWQEYFINENRKIYEALPFDGFQMDQLGNRNTNHYTYNGTLIDLPATYKPFIEVMKADNPQKSLIMNAVNQYGQEGIAQAPVDFLYSEVWSPNEMFSDLSKIIMDNDDFSSNTKKTVLAAYMNYNLANNKGSFNTPSILLADAVIFAFGGAHLELGEHMLGKEYFPNNNLEMKEDLKKALVTYYDFLVAYQNLLRDGGTFNNPSLSNIGQIQLNNWPPQSGQVSVVGKEVGNKQVIHLLNFSSAATFEWRDTGGIQPYPQVVKDVKLSFTSSKTVTKLWFASPDFDKGAPIQLDFTQSGDKVSFTLPSLQYWDMIVAEY
ncbi:MAG TPA: glycoside hydrolase family 66 protein [Cytophagales bacterium]|nr:glycoside hydrolase family 66 protein [Cytophagales bacterium]